MTAGSQRLPLPPATGCLAELGSWARSWMDQNPTDGVDPDSVVHIRYASYLFPAKGDK